MSATHDDAVVLTQMAESYRSLAVAGIHYAAELTALVRQRDRTIDHLRERIAEHDARLANLEAELARYTHDIFAGSEAA
jgi:hypothetical protein